MKNLTKSQWIHLGVMVTCALVGALLIYIGTTCTPDVVKISVSAESDPAEIAERAEALKLVADQLGAHVRVATLSGAAFVFLLVFVTVQYLAGEKEDWHHLEFVGAGAIALVLLYAATVSLAAWILGVFGGVLLCVAGFQSVGMSEYFGTVAPPRNDGETPGPSENDGPTDETSRPD